MASPTKGRGSGSRGQVTLVDVAREASCSVSLASIVMRGAPGASEVTRARVKAVADRLGYRPDQRARGLRRVRSGLIGVTFRVHHPFHADLVEGLYRAVGDSGYELVLGGVVRGTDDVEAAEPLLRDRCEALVMVGPTVRPARLESLAAEIPVVAVARPLRVEGVDVVRIDDGGGIAMAVEHLRELGHRRITHIDGAGAPSSVERVAGYLSAMDAHGLAGQASVVRGGTEEADGVRAAAHVLEAQERPTALTVFNDRCATGVVNRLIQAGVDVPGEMSVVGFDDSGQAVTALVPLTTVAQDTRLMARTAFERAVARAGRRYLPGEQVLVPRLVPRDSSGPVPPEAAGR
ncbi:LacI family DNA-binding transcriptional regulator [Actinomyces wuliandei]|uniref:LacI family DNA-binding transcriptional regulator n=1 Tax=Actinomyces wuliandei TaxID=2057743 RepID=UPI001FAA40CA|nr:LacI family DNA-binding transcriptional regulator [Actinomyces wuliandei]